MSSIDWIIMLGTLAFIVGYGTWKTRGSKNIGDYLKGGNNEKWWAIGLSVMATQASAITFLSTPGQAYMQGMGFVQFYLGLPIAMVIISMVFIPLYFKLKVYTAYEFLESRFDLKTRVLTASLFLLQRGLAAGITIYAPAIILSQIIGWPLEITILFIGILVIIYTVSGGTKAVTQTHKQQMAVIFFGMFIAFGALVYYLSEHVGFLEGIKLAGNYGKMEIIDTEFDAGSRYNIWSGIIGGLFLQLSYFGTDQSQVQRYLSGKSVRESRLGLMFNGLLKIPMQFFILLVGVLVFLFYQFNLSPIHFNKENVSKVEQSAVAGEWAVLEANYKTLHENKQQLAVAMVQANNNGNAAQIHTAKQNLKQAAEKETEYRNQAVELIAKTNPKAETEDDDYIFITFVMDYLPIGIVGLLLAVIFSAAMSSTSAELNALGTTATIDIYKRNFKQEASEKHYLLSSKWLTFLFGVLAIVFAILASLFDNLIEAVNILGSIFYGTILGIFLVAFFLKRIKAAAVFAAALVSQTIIIVLYWMGREGIYEIAYLWYNLIAPTLVIGLGIVFQQLQKKESV